MRLSKALDVFEEVKGSLQIGFIPTLRAILRKPSLLLHPSLISREFMSHVWVPLGNGMDENLKDTKTSLLTPNAYGTVLDIGAGYGHTVQYLDRSKVTKYVAVEPNANMHAEIRAKANRAGFTEEAGTFILVPYGAEHVNLIESALGGLHSVDTIVFIMALCGVPKPQETIRELAGNMLKPGGQVLFYEHVLSRRSDVAWWQHVWTPVYNFIFDGCCLDRPTDIWLENLGIWESKDLWGEDDTGDKLFWYRGGKLIKAT